MRFGTVPVAEAEGAYVAHKISLPDGVIQKGTRLDAAEVARLKAAGVAEVIAARLDAGDIHEDEAARRLADAVASDGLRVAEAFTGRANLYADAPGLLVVDRAAIDRINRADPSITIATLAPFTRVEAGQMAATVKIIPFAAPADRLGEAEAAAQGGKVLGLAPFQPKKVGVVATMLPSLKTSVMDKTMRILEGRLAPAGAGVMAERRVPHEEAAVARELRRLKAEGADILLVFGASAVVDERDVIPAAIRSAGGRVIQFGMPVDPGNLLVLGEIAGTPVVGAPGCVRSPKENGFDWILYRLLADLTVTAEDITGLGVGGLLIEIPSRPQPRERPETKKRPRIAALILAAGRSRRMGGPNKLLAELGGKAMVRRVAEAALASKADSVTVVTGHETAKVAAVLSGLKLHLVENPEFAEGLSTSLKAGVEALPEDSDAVLVLLGDMPDVSAVAIDTVIGAFEPDAGSLIVVPTSLGKRGNPVLWARRYFGELKSVKGDAGARHLIGENAGDVREVEIGPEVTLDLDTPDALAAAAAVYGGR